MFTIATRRTWEIRNFANFNRYRNTTTLTESQRFPLYINGIWGAETDWSVRVLSNNSRQLPLAGGAAVTRGSNALQVRVNSFNRSAFTLGSTFAVEHYRDTATAENTALDLGLESTSTSRFSRNVNLAGSYHVKAFLERDSSGNNATYITHDASFNARYAPAQTISLVASERLQMGTGDNLGTSANSVVQSNPDFQNNNASAQVSLNRDQNISDYWRSVSGLSVSWTPLARLSTSLRGSIDVLSVPGRPYDITATLDHHIDYQLRDLSISLSSSGILRDNGIDPQYLQFSSTGRVQYRPNRNVDTVLASGLSTVRSSGTSSSFINLLQSARYLFFSRRGIERQLGELTEEFTISQNNGDFQGETASRKTLWLTGRYYPTTRVSLTGSAGVRFYESSFEQVYAAGLGLNMKIMDASVDYSYAKRDSDNRIEKRFSAAVRKTF